jgi:hypothetical protein
MPIQNEKTFLRAGPATGLAAYAITWIGNRHIRLGRIIFIHFFIAENIHNTNLVATSAPDTNISVDVFYKLRNPLLLITGQPSYNAHSLYLQYVYVSSMPL